MHGQIQLEQYQKDAIFLECNTIDIKNVIVQLVQTSIEKNYSIEDIQVLSPMYNGSAGINVLNKALQEAFNPPSKEKLDVKLGYITFREGDKVLQLKNQPDDKVYNGDIGIIQEIIPPSMSEDKKTTIVVCFDEEFVEYKPEDFSNITLAYCISVHKSQGSEYSIVMMPFTSQHTIMLNRKLIYTAITRSKKSLIMVGDKNVFLNGCSISERHVRNTYLKEKIQESFQKEF